MSRKSKSKQTKDSAQISPRFEHKSQGLRTQSLNEKKAEEAAARAKEEEALKSRQMEESQKEEAQEASSARIRESSDSSVSKAQSEKASSSEASSGLSSYAEGSDKGSGSKKKAAAVSSASLAAVFKGLKKKNGKNSDDSPREYDEDNTIIVNEKDIPAYEVGLVADEYYIPEGIRIGKVARITEDQFGEISYPRRKKKKTRRQERKEERKRKTPAQKAAKVILWVAVWVVVFLLAFVCFKITYNVFYDIAVDPDSTEKIEYTVTADATDESVYEDLEALGVVNCSEFIYKLRAIVFDAEYVEGTYYISDGYNMEKIINILAGYEYSDSDEE